MKPMTMMFVTGLLMASFSAHAAVKQGAHQISVSLGAANPLSHEEIDGEYTEFGSVGPALGFSYLYQFRQYLSFGADLNFKRLGDRDFRTGRGPLVIESSAWTLMAVARGDLMPEGDLRPYGVFGLGLGGVRRELRYSLNPRFDRDQTSSGLAFAAGAGLDFDVNESWLAGAELRYNYINTEMQEVGASSVRTLDLLFKVGYKF